MDSLIEMRFENKYEIQGEISHRSAEVVYHGFDIQRQHHVTIMILVPDPNTVPESLRRLREVTRESAYFIHPNILRTYDVDEYDGMIFVVFEEMRGDTLDQWLKREGTVSLDQTKRVLQQLASALEYVHESGNVHLNVKTSNIVLEPDGRVKLMGVGLNELGYMAPEQIIVGPVDSRADVYSLGVVIYEMLTGHVPFHRPSPTATAHAQVNEPAPPFRNEYPEIPAAVEAVVLKALARLPSERYQRVGDFSHAFAVAALGIYGPLQRRLRDLQEDLGANYKQQSQLLDDVSRLRLRRQAAEIEEELMRVAQRLKDEPDPFARTFLAQRRPQDRVLDAAIPRTVYVGKATELLVQVRLVESNGLRAVLEFDTTYAPKPEEVLSKQFVVEFPLDSAGQPEAAQLRIRVVSRDFDPREREKRILVPPNGDSEIVTFQLIPLRLGELVVHVEVYKARVFAASRPLRTNSQTEETSRPKIPRYVVISFPVIAIPVYTLAAPLPAPEPHFKFEEPRPVPAASSQKPLSRRSGRISSAITLLLIILVGATFGGITYVQLGSSLRVTPFVSPTLAIIAASSTPTASSTATPTSTSTPLPTATTPPTATLSVAPTSTMTATPTATSTMISIVSPTTVPTSSPQP